LPELSWQFRFWSKRSKSLRSAPLSYTVLETSVLYDYFPNVIT
jgi:hypothetical protein